MWAELPTFWKYMLPPSSQLKSLLNPEERSSTYLQWSINVLQHPNTGHYPEPYESNLPYETDLWSCTVTVIYVTYIPEDDILHSHCCENLKFYITLTGWAL
jgi:hypothetical protein